MKKFLLLCIMGVAAPIGIAPGQAAPLSPLQKAPIKWPTIRIGDDDEMGGFNTRVAALQYLLRGRGLYRGKIDGIYGVKTAAAVKAFQKSKKLRVDGITGPQTLPLLVVNVKRGSKGDAVRAAQILARGAYGHNGETPNIGLEVDGSYGAETQEAIRIAQSCENGLQDRLVVDGIMGRRSWCLMLGGKVVGQE